MFFKMRVFVILVSLLVTQIYSASLPENLSKKHEELLSKLSDYRLVRPYRSTSEGEFMTYDLSTQSEEDHLEFRRTTRDHNERRRKRSIQNGGTGEEFIDDHEDLSGEDARFHFIVDGFGSRLRLNVTRNLELFSPGFKVNWYSENGDITEEIPDVRCFYQGAVNHDPLSSAAVSNCQGLSGWIKSGNDEFIIEPIDISHHAITNNFTIDGIHILYRTRDFSGLDNLHLGNFRFPVQETLENDIYQEDIETFEVNRTSVPHRSRRSPSDRQHYVETMVAADYSMFEFHGRPISTYIATMVNIMNLAYAHPSLGVNMKFVLTKINLLNRAQSKNMVVEGNAAASLTNICRWASSQASPEDDSPDHYDYTAFFTKKSFGPAGFAPVTGMCGITRSCSVNHDEGLLTAYVMAHEAGHVLGMEHDGQGENDCQEESVTGSIMAPIVSSTYNNYFWSSCSKRELFRHLGQHFCLWDNPFNTTDDTPYPGTRYTMNNQCEFDFGRGSITCNGLYTVDLCGRLYCMLPGRQESMLCRTRKSFPLDGTACEPGKWCIQGQCRYITNRQDGGWNEWEEWSECSYPCGVGVLTRIRKCNNPPPRNGGRHCSGEGLQYRLCNLEQCSTTSDRRAEQCQANLARWMFKGQNHTWLPFQNRNRTQQCRLTCISQQSGDVVVSEYNVTDGTPCTYEHPDNICVQGKCVPLGCDKSATSNLGRDNCGVCGGDNSNCRFVEDSIRYTPVQARKYKKLTKIPAGAMNFMVEEVTDSPYFLALRDAATGGKYILNSKRVMSKSHDFVFGNARYIYTPDEPERIVTKGPLSRELQLQAYITADISIVDVRWSYYIRVLRSTVVNAVDTTHVADDMEIPDVPVYPSTPEGFIWEPRGWTECTVSCGGGVSYYRYHCRRLSDNMTVSKNQCNQGDYKKTYISKVCNAEECGPQLPPPSYEWYPRDWGSCSLTCGGEGVSNREVVCKDVRRENNVILQSEVVNDGFCLSDAKPETHTTCTVRPCTADWITGSWSDCSESCGQGNKVREVLCNKPTDTEFTYQCFRKKPATAKSCILEDCPATECKPRSTDLCEPKFYSNYCHLNGYEDFCCATCEEQQAKWEEQQARKKKNKKKKNKNKKKRNRSALVESPEENLLLYLSTLLPDVPSSSS